MEIIYRRLQYSIPFQLFDEFVFVTVRGSTIKSPSRSNIKSPATRKLTPHHLVEDDSHVKDVPRKRSKSGDALQIIPVSEVHELSSTVVAHRIQALKQDLSRQNLHDPSGPGQNLLTSSAGSVYIRSGSCSSGNRKNVRNSIHVLQDQLFKDKTLECTNGQLLIHRIGSTCPTKPSLRTTGHNYSLSRSMEHLDQVLDSLSSANYTKGDYHLIRLKSVPGFSSKSSASEGASSRTPKRSADVSRMRAVAPPKQFQDSESLAEAPAAGGYTDRCNNPTRTYPNSCEGKQLPTNIPHVAPRVTKVQTLAQLKPAPTELLAQDRQINNTISSGSEDYVNFSTDF